MSLVYLEISVIGICLACLFVLSLVESALSQSSPLALRMLMEKDGKRLPPLLQTALESETRLLVPLHFGTQVCIITVAILTTHVSLKEWPHWGVAGSFGVIIVLSLLFRQLLPRLFTQNEPERKLVSLLRTFGPAYHVLRRFALPLSKVLDLSQKLHESAATETKPVEEYSEKEIQAYLEIGEDEGILQREDSELIQSVVEFGDTLAREVMTSRTKIIACNENATVDELRDAMVQNRHSRIPIYRDDIDHIIGIAYMRQLMAHYVHGKGTDSISGLIHPAHFVPETKPVSVLLRELQERGDHAAIVIDEFGGVAGLVTMEDLLEEIVGEIRDEDQAKVSEVVEEGPGSYLLRGSAELHRLVELAGKRLNAAGSSTVAGLIVSYLGRVPAPGEEFDLEGIRIQVLDADRRRIHKIRARIAPPVVEPGKQTPAPPRSGG